MPEGPFGGPRPLLNQRCQFVVESMLTDRENIYHFRNIFDDPQPAAVMQVEDSGVNDMDEFPPTLWVRLAGDRISVEDLVWRAGKFQQETGASDMLDRMSVKTQLENANALPRPFATGTTVDEQIIIDGRFTSQSDGTEIANSMGGIVSRHPIVKEWAFNPDRPDKSNEIIIVTGESNVTMTELKELQEDMGDSLVGYEDLILTCSAAEFQ